MHALTRLAKIHRPSLSLLIGLVGGFVATSGCVDPKPETFEVVSSSSALTFKDTSGIISMEAEHFTTNTAQGSKSWANQTTSSPSGGAALIATPDTGVVNNTGYTTASPRLNFDVTFSQAGTYQVWVRGRAGGSVAADSDSVHVGLDGVAVASADRISTFTATFGWSRSTLDSVNATLNVATAGLHTVNVWMREDGFVIDKLVLTRDAAYTPTGTGPAETPNTAPACPDATCNGTETCSTCPADCGACPTCTDGIKNGTETGVDCGGSCSACPSGPSAVWLEAESGVRSGSPTFTVQTDAQASGGQNLLPPTGSSANTPGTGRVRYTFTVGAGTFKVWARAITPNADDDSFFVAMDGGTWVKWNGLPATSSWAWDDLHNSDASNAVVTYTLAAGSHTLDVANREDGARLDKLYVTALGDTPSGLGGGTGPTCTDGTQNGTETGVDCGGSCPACPTCADGVRNGTETGVDCGGSCPACPTCTDGTQNGTETGIDCGGSCPACPTCTDGVRNGTETGVDCGGSCPACPVPTCTDGIQNGTETGIDCGGSCAACPTCSDGVQNGTETGVDCGGSCAACPTCSDGVKNGTETGVDCGGSCAACTPGATTVWLEAEAGARSGSPTFTVATSTAASGGSYLNATNDSPNAVGPSRVTFTVNVLAGTYALWARVIAPNASDDSLWVKMDSGAFVKWNDIAASSAWVWARVKNSDSGNALVSYTLAAGTHTIEIANRENGVFIDKLYLTANGDTPSGLGGGNETCGNATCGGGETCTTCPADCGVCGPWSNGDVGAVAAAGSMTQVSGVFTVSGSGDDIHSLYGNPMDEFHFVYQQVTGDATIVARVNSVQNTNEWAKAGVMFRSALDTGAAFAFILARPDRQVQAQFRATAATTGTDSGTQTGGTTAAKWLKIERVGNTFRTSYSTDGSSYTQIGTTTTVTMGATAYVGLAVTSHVDGTLCAAQFDNVSVTTVSVCNNNGTCNAGENCSNCAADCGACGQLGLDTRPSNTTCLAPAPLAASYALQDKWSFAFTNPVQVVQPPGDSTRLIVVQRAGSARNVPIGATSSSQTSAFLTLSNVVTSSNGGFLSMAFHPSWATNRYAYVVYTTANRMKRLSRFTSTDGGQTLNASTEQVVLQIQHLVEFNHNGGQIAFGGDGYLYMSTGDDAYQDYARARQAANTNNLFGKVLRIDVNSGSPYAIPLDNPFALGGGAPEVYAYGFRNPWRFSVDRLTGDIWVADVGENTWEEVNVLQSGGFYGWPYYEGDGCFQNSSSQPSDCSTPFVHPVTTYGGGSGGRSISGGYVYRGAALPSLYGKYLFGDYVTGQVYIYDPATDLNAPLPNSTGGATVAWGEDNAGELYAVRYDTGRVQQLVIGSGGGAADFPQSLHQTGCFDTVNRTQVTSGVIPYTIAQGFWSDGADKERYLALPNGTTISVDGSGDWVLPEGSVVIKNFRYNGKLFETRFVVRHTAGKGYSAYTYSWSDDEQNATLVPAAGVSRTLAPGYVWDYPARDQCFACHTTAAGFTLGPETRQLNVNGFYPSTGRTANQFATLASIGMFSGNPAALAPLPAIGDTAVSLQTRAEAYLHVNCAQCHRPGGPGVGPMDARFDTTFASKGVCNVAPTLGNLGTPGAMMVKPGDPQGSIVYKRMSTRVSTSMPPLASKLVDTQGAALLESWITGLTTCP